jgi:predicted RecB family nuclease
MQTYSIYAAIYQRFALTRSAFYQAIEKEKASLKIQKVWRKYLARVHNARTKARAMATCGDAATLQKILAVSKLTRDSLNAASNPFIQPTQMCAGELLSTWLYDNAELYFMIE